MDEMLPGTQFDPPPNLFFAFLAQKTHVKSQNHLTLYESKTYAWRISYGPSAILDTVS